jgi:hypothetical protein
MDHDENGSGAAPPSPLQPLYLFADSQLLFWKDQGVPFLLRARQGLDARSVLAPKAAYLGASSDDEPAFYEIFVGAMDGIGIGVRDCRHILASPSAEDRVFLDDADLILLAGGDVERGLAAFHASGLHHALLARYAAGAVLLGVSAGAVQLGLKPAGRGDPALATLRLAPFFVGVHDEPDWTGLAEAVTAAGERERGIGVPLGGGAIVHPDITIEPVRKALTELFVENGQLRRALLLPGGPRGN